MQVKNKDALKKCGFLKILDKPRIWHWVETGVNVDRLGISVEKENELIFYNIEGNEKTLLSKLIEMTKAGCFDEKPKTLEELEFEIEVSNKLAITYVNKNTSHRIYFKKIPLKNEWVWYNFTLDINLELHQAIMLKMEELKNANK